ncbi:MAG: hypothetical protein JOS17DRAFT_761117 [Linnemannia elongata]|nr:MAG: hypothetical protein JOS17DRAFT_761117 [Linnemannia elongata]
MSHQVATYLVKYRERSFLSRLNTMLFSGFPISQFSKKSKMSEAKGPFYPIVTEETEADRRSRFSCLERCLRISVAILLPLTMISLAIYAGYASSELTEYGSCPSEFDTVNAGHCAKRWSLSLKGPPVQCDATSRFNVPYWYRSYPLCTTKEVNILTTLSVVTGLLFFTIALYGSKN